MRRSLARPTPRKTRDDVNRDELSAAARCLVTLIAGSAMICALAWCVGWPWTGAILAAGSAYALLIVTPRWRPW